MINDILPIVLLAGAVLLLPLVPAFLLYRFLPSTTHVSGPFKGLSLQLTGAFAGYFVLTLGTGALVWDLYTANSKQKASRLPPLWQIRGQVLLGPDGSPPQDKVADIVLEPGAETRPAGPGLFEIHNLPGRGDHPDLAFIQVTLPGYEPWGMELGNAQDSSTFQVTYDTSTKVMKIGRPILLKPASSPLTNGQVPVPVQD